MVKALQWQDLKLKSKLGEGQAGTVWLAKLKIPFQDLPNGSYVAVKIYKSWVLEEGGQFERIISELEIGRRLDHPNLLKTFSLIRDNKGNPALVMAYYSGETLEQYLQKLRDIKKIPDSETVFHIISGLISALSILHKSGVIHRDVKPSNIILDGGNPILMDLGVIRSQDFPEQTGTGNFLGTIRYAAPEYLFGEEYDFSVDIYSLGAVAFELFIGKTFLSEENQWARLITKKDSKNSDVFQNVNYDIILQHFGVKAFGFILFLLNNFLETSKERRKINLDHLAKAINNQLWNAAYYIQDGKIISGEPNLPAINKSDGLTMSPKEIADFLRKELSKKEFELLQSLLEKAYIGIIDRSLEGVDHDEIVKSTPKFLETGVFEEHHTGYEGYGRYYTITHSVKASYRYGYI